MPPHASHPPVCFIQLYAEPPMRYDRAQENDRIAAVARPYGDHLGRLQQWGRRDDGEGQRVGWRAKAPRENHRSLGTTHRTRSEVSIVSAPYM